MSIEDAVQTAIAKAHQTVRNIRWFRITETRSVTEGEVVHWHGSLKIGFALESKPAGTATRHSVDHRSVVAGHAWSHRSDREAANNVAASAMRSSKRETDQPLSPEM